MCIFTFFQYREERFRQTSESTNSRVLWWSLGQTCILIVMGAWQMRHLKTFFEAKKLVWKYKKCLSIMWDTTLLYLQQSKSNFQILKNHRFRCDFFQSVFSSFSVKWTDNCEWMKIVFLRTVWKKNPIFGPNINYYLEN